MTSFEVDFHNRKMNKDTEHRENAKSRVCPLTSFLFMIDLLFYFFPLHFFVQDVSRIVFFEQSIN